MDLNTLQKSIYEMNEEEIFYKKYREAEKSKESLHAFLSQIDKEEVYKKHRLILEWPDTIPLGRKYDDTFFFDMNDTNAILVQRHNRYSPPLMHSHTFFELIYVYDGTCVQKLNHTENLLHTGDVCIIPPGVLHAIDVNDSSVILNVLIRKDTLHNIFFNFLSTQNILSSFFLNNIYGQSINSYIIFHTGQDYEIRRGFLYMYWESLNKSMYYYQMIGNTLTLCFGLLIRNYSHFVETPSPARRNEEQSDKLLQYIQANYAAVTAEETARVFSYSREYVSRLIKEATGLSFTGFVQKVRMEKAQDLLRNTNMTVAEIAEQVGYSSPEHFIRLFRRFSKMTPTGYRHSQSDNKEKVIIARL